MTHPTGAAEGSAEAQPNRPKPRKGRFPFPIPTGWFSVAYSPELAVGEVKAIRYFARDLVLFRTSDGVAHVLDAYCPHLGAHLGHGGKLEADKLTCPFHAWQFDGSGACVRIPYGDKIPKRASVRAWRVDEKNGHIYVWHDLGGREPLWEMPELPEAAAGEDWTPVRTRSWVIHTCNQEMAENQVDAAHFHYVHGAAEMPRTTTERQGYVLKTLATTAMTTPVGRVDGQLEVTAWGFGFSTTRFTGLVETFLMSSATPIDEETCQLSFAFTVRNMGKGITGGIGKAFMAEIARQLEQDIPIWENKVYVDPPLICDGDGPIGIFRQWSKQFYPATPAPSDAADVATAK
jgi:phenylpropionate dioxygenase-like ring-hydroxylating dioxygenase large terminal subunit